MSVVARVFRTSALNVTASRCGAWNIPIRSYSAEAAAPAEPKEAKTAPCIEEIVDKISKLNVLQIADLTALLKKRLNIADAPMMAAAPMAASAGGAGAEAEEAPKAAVQTEFTVKLTGVDDTQKVKLIREIKNVVAGLNLVQAKKFVESIPQTLKENISKADAEELKKTLSAVGGTVTIE